MGFRYGQFNSYQTATRTRSTSRNSQDASRNAPPSKPGLNRWPESRNAPRFNLGDPNSTGSNLNSNKKAST